MSKESCKAWYRKNKKYRYEYMKKYRAEHPEYRIKNKLMLRKRKKLKPWISHFDCARTRCLNKKRKTYNRYGGRGIKFLLKPSEIKELWFRFKAFRMKLPTIDRIDNDGNYEINNCRFVEKSVNSTKGNYEARWV